jgi:Kinesin motor domain
MSFAIDTNVRLMNTKIVCRIRPFTQNERQIGGHGCVDYTTNNIEVFTSSGQHPFDCDNIFDESASQMDLFDYCARPLVEDALAGINSTILAYGQTSSGKTYTIEGDKSDPSKIGIVPRTVTALLEAAAEKPLPTEFTFRISYIEIYMEKVKDLLIEEVLPIANLQRTLKIVGVNISSTSFAAPPLPVTFTAVAITSSSEASTETKPEMNMNRILSAPATPVRICASSVVMKSPVTSASAVA